MYNPLMFLPAVYTLKGSMGKEVHISGEAGGGGGGRRFGYSGTA